MGSGKNTDKKQKEKLENKINEVLEVLESWARENNMIVSKTKTIYQNFSLKHANPDFNIKIGNDPLTKSDSTKYLGVILDTRLTWEDQVNKTSQKANKRIGLMKRLAGAKWGCNQDSLNITYNTYVKPIITYGSEVVATANKSRLERLERAQSNALRLISGGVKTTSITALQLYTKNPPLVKEIEKLAAASLVKMETPKRQNGSQDAHRIIPVSYTHLDVYKRQVQGLP